MLGRHRCVRQPPAAEVGLLREVTLVALDVSAAEIADRRDLGRLRAARRRTRAGRASTAASSGPQREAHLLDVALQRRPQPRRERSPTPARERRTCSGRACAAAHRSRRRETTSPLRRTAASSTAALDRARDALERRGDQLLAAAVSSCALVSRSGATPATAATFATAHHCSSADFGVEPQLGGDLHEPLVELAVNPRCDLPDPQLARAPDTRPSAARGR